MEGKASPYSRNTSSHQPMLILKFCPKRCYFWWQSHNLLSPLPSVWQENWLVSHSVMWNRTPVQAEKQPSKQKLFLAQIKPSIQSPQCSEADASEQMSEAKLLERLLKLLHHQKKCFSNYCPRHFWILLSKNTRFF